MGYDYSFPPCTYLSNAGACRLYPQKRVLDQERYKKGLAAKEFFMKFLDADCQRIAIENPVSSTVFQMPKHSQEIQPWQFGDPYTKKTRLWLRGLHPLVPTHIVTPDGPYVPAETGAKTVVSTEPQSVERMLKTELRRFLASQKQWLSSGREILTNREFSEQKVASRPADKLVV